MFVKFEIREDRLVACFRGCNLYVYSIDYIKRNDLGRISETLRKFVHDYDLQYKDLQTAWTLTVNIARGIKK